MANPTQPPYARIAAELRRRITDGELAPGERVPSTRRLAQEWNVALATATRALTVLRQEGLVQARPRVGTVVATRRRHPAPPPGHRTTDHPARETEVTRERVVRAAVAIADAEGLAALSMRSVAARLGTATMTAYRYVNGKDDLVLLMADTVLADLPLPHRTAAESAATAGWRGRLEAGARALWQVHRAHPWLAQIGPLTRPLLLPNLMTYSEWMLSALDGHGLSPATMLNVNVLLYSHVQGLAVQSERETAARSATGQTDEEWLADQSTTMTALTTSGAYPTFTRVVGALGRDGYDLRLDELFTLGLTALLDGVAHLLDET
ncbi:GntR family transcriptional regulator [Streptomyces diacarni]|uniref:GntR family transcriptional regulator n=1 Tax=Streptomyces diacarni TaxID=2800381 RepID=A0A367FET2_9ACTN|nr:GntR family transcriptional regulator [Streptomyces diacarni]RCG28886.1 GntR family transcriptional regulator [Streptomyces diacarni]